MFILNLWISKTALIFLCYLLGIIVGVFIKKDMWGDKIKYFVINESCKVIYTNNVFLILFIFISFILLSIDYYNMFVSDIIDNSNQLGSVLLNMSDNSVNNNAVPVIDASGGVVNINNPSPLLPLLAALEISKGEGSVSISESVARTIGTSIATAGGITAGVKLAQQMPSVGGKALAVAGSAVLSQVVNITANKYLDADSSSKNNNGSNLVSNLSNINVDKSTINSIIDSNGLDVNEKYSKFPLNLIPDLNVYIDVEIIFLIVLCNVLFTSYLIEKNINFDRYIKNESINKWVKLLYNRYVRIWSTSKWVLIVWSLICLIICVLISKIILITLLS